MMTNYFIKITIKSIVLLPLFFISFSYSCFAQQLLHVSATVHYELTEQNWPGYDLTLIFKGNYGFRYSLMPEFSFLETISDDDGIVKSNHFTGDLKLPMVLKMLDFKTFQEGPTQIFDFITAYVGVGYNNFELTLTQKNYHAEADTLVKTTGEETVHSNIGAISFGIYGGDSFLIFDFRLRYLRGEIEASDYVNEENQYDKWMMIVSLGFGM